MNPVWYVQYINIESKVICIYHRALPMALRFHLATGRLCTCIGGNVSRLASCYRVTLYMHNRECVTEKKIYGSQGSDATAKYQ